MALVMMALPDTSRHFNGFTVSYILLVSATCIETIEVLTSDKHISSCLNVCNNGPDSSNENSLKSKLCRLQTCSIIHT